jgi:hypothetical protein
VTSTPYSDSINYLDHYYETQIKPTLDRLAVVTSAAAVVSKTAVHAKPSFSSLPSDIVQQLRQDGTRDGLRPLAEAREIYDNLPNTLTTIQDVRDVVASADYELGHIIPHAHGGPATADNVTYMPSDLNRSIGDRLPTSGELDTARSAVANEGLIGDNPFLDSAFNLAAGATAPVAARISGTGARLVGGIVRQDSEAVARAFSELPDQLATGAVEGVTRGVPAAIGGSIAGPAGAVAGLVASDFIEAAMTDDDSVRFQKCMEGSAKAGVATVLLLNPPLAAAAGIGWLAGKFFNIW